MIGKAAPPGWRQRGLGSAVNEDARRRPLTALSTRRGVLAVVPLAFLAGCAAVGGTKATSDTFGLSAPKPADVSSVRRGTQILITEPAALKALDSENIVVETAPLTIQYLDEAQWGDRLPKIVQQRLAAAFDATGRFSGVGLPGQGLAIDYQLITEIRAFGIDATAGRAKVEIAAKLLNDRNGTVIATRVFSEEVAVAASAGNPVLVAAIDRAFGRVATEIVSWVAGRL